MSTETSPATAQLRVGIEHTRSEMSSTIDAIQAQLNPQHIAHQVREQVREQIEEVKTTVRNATIGKAETLMRDAGDTMTEATSTLNDTIRHNPLPAAMVAIGLGWLFMNRGSARPRPEQRYNEQSMQRGRMAYATNHPAYRGEAMAMYPTTEGHTESTIARAQHKVGEGVNQAQSAVGDAAQRAQSAVGGAVNQAQSAVGDAAQRAQSAVGDAVNQAQSAVGDAMDQAQRTAGDFAGRSAYQAERLEDRFQQTLRENPLAIGALALALGTAVGFSLPQTERENQLMGETRDHLVEQAQSSAQQTLEKVQQVAGDVLQDAEQKTTDKAREVGLVGKP